ncbi:MAG TPA: ATP-binding protein [Tepidisphaeraceae bacterium]|jgi:heavy metal sensor kinase|nr:ATP-binding protein [Tepidisphaeraceae bacterium]
MIRSLRLRLLVHTSLAAALMLGLLGAALYFFVRHSIEADFNQDLLAKAHAVAATAEQHGQTIIFDYEPDELPQFVTSDHPDYFQAWIDPKVVLRSPSLKQADLPRLPVTGEVVYRDMVLPDGRPGRMVGMSFTTTIEPNAGRNILHAENSRTVILSVATDTIALHRTLENLGWLLVGLCLLAVAASGIVLVWIVGRAVRPLERIARDIDELQENDLSVRLHPPDVPLELQPVVEKLNGLLSRLDAAFSREKAFTADVAHELRTPVTALLTTFEVCRSRPRDEVAYIAAIDKCRGVAHRMQTLVESLLLLARAEAGQLPLKLQSTDAADLLDDCWAMFSPRAEDRRMKLQWQADGPIPIETDPEKLRIILHNLFDNAVSYADEAGSIRIAAELRGNEFRVEVANTGSHVGAEQEKHLFERFWRGDKARAEVGVHCGLGLSLCQRLARLLKGRIEVQTAEHGWFTVRLTLPAGHVEQPAPSITAPVGSVAD